MPTVWELETLVYCRSGQDKGRSSANSEFPYELYECVNNSELRTIADTAFPYTAGTSESPTYWTSTLMDLPDYDGYVWVVDFNSGGYDGFGIESLSFVRLVRTPK